MEVGFRWLAVLLIGAFASVGHAQRQRPQPVPMNPRVGQVTAVEKSELEVDLGTRDGVSRRDLVEIATADGSVVVPVLVALEHTSRVFRPMGIEIPEGSAVRLTGARPTATRLVPMRASYFGFEARIFGVPSVNENSGGGVIGDVRLRYRARAPIALQLRVSPIGFGSGDFTTIGIGHGELGVGYDHRVFGLGATIGATVTEVEDEDSFDFYRTTLGVSTGVYLRLGARDGMHAELGFTYGYTPNGFQWVHARFDALFPLRNRYALVLTASGGRTRHGMGAVGLRGLMRGNGGPGTILLTGYFGAAGILRPGASYPRGFAGPMLGLGVEARF
jgi:hypothetical protein